MKNKLTDLNDYLFEQLERINDDSISPEELDREIKKAQSITSIAETIIKNGELRYKAVAKALEYGAMDKTQMTFLLGVNDKAVQGEKQIQQRNP